MGTGQNDNSNTESGKVRFLYSFSPVRTASKIGLGGLVQLIRGNAIPIIGVGVLLLITSFLWLEYERSFPILPAGRYVGVVHFENQPEPVPLYIESYPEQESMLVVLLREGWEPQVVPRSLSVRGGNRASPLAIIHRSERIRFIGSEVSASLYQGQAEMLNNGLTGLWSLEPVRGEGGIDRGFLNQQASLRNEIELLQERLDEINGQIKSASKERDTLAQFISDERGLIHKAQLKLLSEREQLQRSAAELERLQQEGRELESKLKLAERLTSMGRLVSMARESLEREARWSEAVLKMEQQR